MRRNPAVVLDRDVLIRVLDEARHGFSQFAALSDAEVDQVAECVAAVLDLIDRDITDVRQSQRAFPFAP